MDVPSSMIDLYKANVTLNQPSCHEATISECASLACILAIELVGALRLLGQICQFRNGRLHAERHFELSDAHQCLRVTNLFVLDSVQLTQGIEHAAPHLRGHAFRIINV